MLDVGGLGLGFVCEGLWLQGTNCLRGTTKAGDDDDDDAGWIWMATVMCEREEGQRQLGE